MSQPFAALGVSTPLVEVLDRLGIRSPYPIQELVLREIGTGTSPRAVSTWTRSAT
jgi:superfamily II DNA/RNA helicase